MPYSKLYILTDLRANDVKFISVDRQKLDLSKYIYTYGTVNSIFVEIQPYSTNIKNDPRINTISMYGEKFYQLYAAQRQLLRTLNNLILKNSILGFIEFVHEN